MPCALFESNNYLKTLCVVAAVHMSASASAEFLFCLQYLSLSRPQVADILFNHLKLPSPPVKVWRIIIVFFEVLLINPTRTAGIVTGSCSIWRGWLVPGRSIHVQRYKTWQVMELPRRIHPVRGFFQVGSLHASTSAEVLAGLQGKHAVVAPILEFRGVNKYKST